MKTFEELGIKIHLKHLQEAGFTEPFPIQEQAIPVLLKGRDLVGQAQTGTGKTLAFGLPILEGIDEKIRDTQALIVVPTRELAMQVATELDKISGGTARIAAVFGGESAITQVRYLREARQIIVATPGRLLDFMTDEIVGLNLKKVRFVVLDEADRMLDMGFITDVKEILKNLPRNIQTSMFSATMPPAIQKLAHEFLKNPAKIIVSKDEISNVDINQYFMEVSDFEKLDQLCNILKEKRKTIVFCGSKIRTKRLAQDLHARGFDVEAMHGDMEQPQRTRAMENFRNGKSNILVATDVVARGIDVPTVEQVINFDVPKDAMVYFHRIGRTARAGKKGRSIIFVTREYRRAFDDIRRETRIHIGRIPTQPVPQFPVVRGHEGKSFGGSGRAYSRGYRRMSRSNYRHRRRF